jgi:hypothetical protein
MSGAFGYKIGRKLRLMTVQFDVDLLWQVCVREIYVLMKHYGSIELLREAFEKLIEAKGKPSLQAIEKCKIFTDSTISSISSISNQSMEDWNYLTRYCQHSFINVLESGYFLNNGNKDDVIIFLLDFNTNSVRFYKKKIGKKEIEYEKATIHEIMDFNDMPIKTLTEIVINMKERFEKYNENLKKINEKIENINNIIKKTKELGNEQNIMERTKKILDDTEWERKSLEIQYRFFYYRLDALNLIDYTDK